MPVHNRVIYRQEASRQDNSHMIDIRGVIAYHRTMLQMIKQFSLYGARLDVNSEVWCVIRVCNGSMGILLSVDGQNA
jgi:hypothetical protein